MINLLSSFILLFFTVGLTIFEKRNFNNIITPFTVIAWPLTVISVIANLIVVKFGFLPVTVKANLFILINLFLIWLIGVFLYNLFGKPLEMKNYLNGFSNLKDFRGIIIFFSWIVIFVSLLKVFTILTSQGIDYIATQEYEDQMSRGIAAHLINIGEVLLILLVIISDKIKKNWLYYLTILCLGLSIISVMVKYPIIWTVLIILFIKNLSKPAKVQIKKFSYIALFVIFVFFLNFAILFSGWGTFSFENKRMWVLISGWFFNYLFSGPMLLDKWMELAYSKPWWTIFTVFKNFINVVIGNPERLNSTYLVSPGFMRVSPDFLSNVGTSFGTYYLIGGFTFTVLATIIFAFFSYYFYFKSFHSRNKVVIFINALFLVMGTLSFFGQYFTLISFYELTFIYMVLLGIFEIVLKIKNAKPINA